MSLNAIDTSAPHNTYNRYTHESKFK